MKRGFSLIEVIVVAGIIGLLAVLMIVNFQLNRKQHQLTNAVQEMVLNIRQAQNMAMAGQLQPGQNVRGYGLYTQSANQYLIFYNLIEEKKYVSGFGASITIETITLPEEVTLSPTDQSVFFVPPDPETYINNSKAEGASLTLTLSANGLSQNIIIYTSGRIEIE